MALMQPAAMMPEWLGRRAYLSPHAPALMADGERWTFAALDARARAAARWLRTAAHNAGEQPVVTGAGVVAGPRIAVLLPDDVNFVTIVHALPKIGAVLVPVNARLTAAEIAWQLQRCGARVLVHDDTYAPTARDVAGAVSGLQLLSVADANLPDTVLPATAHTEHEEVAGHAPRQPQQTKNIATDAVHSIIFTSGTTGRPKGAMLTYGNFWWSATTSALNLGVQADDCWLACMPLFHVGGLSILLRSVLYGTAVVLHDGFDADAVNRAIDTEKVTLLSAVATMLQRMLDARGDKPYPDTLRAVLLGGGPAPPPLLRRAAAAGVRVLQTYGLTESASQAATLAPDDALRKLGSAGKPLFATDVRIVDVGETIETKHGERRIGEIALAGPTITPGYWDDKEATAAVMRDGLFHTGDLGYLDDEGYLYVVDRRVDLIVSGGENVYPAEVEAVLLQHDAVAEAGVVGVAHSEWGQVPVAVVVRKDGATVSGVELQTFCRDKLAGYKVPRYVHFAPSLPRTAAGKLRRSALREAVRAAGGEQR